MMLASVLDRISGMSDDAALEAVKLLASDLLAITFDELVGQGTSARDVGQAPIPAALEAATSHEAAELARFVLAVATAAGHAGGVTKTLDETTEPPPTGIDLISVLAFGVLRAVLKKGPKGAKDAKDARDQTTVTDGTDGSLIVHTAEQTHTYAVGDGIVQLAMKALHSLIPD